MKLELVFPLLGSKTIPVDHGHGLYGALKNIVPSLESTERIGIHPLRGTPSPSGMLQLDPRRSRLRLRVSSDQIPALMCLAGKTIRVLGSPLTLGAPALYMLTPSSTLWARTVTMKFSSPSWEDAERQLRSHLEADYPEASWQIRKPRTIRIHGKQILGFEVLATGLTEADSMRLQEEGFGGRRAFGCGIFVRVGENVRA